VKAKLRPNLAALRALEAAARLRSFTLAAEELHLTHSAVSHQIRQLEAALETTLFSRVGTEMIPTPSCLRLTLRLRQALSDMDQALEEARSEGSPSRRQLNLNVMADLANVWLIPRLADFSKAHPDIDLSLSVHHAVTPPDPRSVDVGIWHRRVDQHGFRSDLLLEDQVIAVCSPEFRQRHAPLTLAALPNVPLLHFATRSWLEFFQAAGIPHAEPRSGPSFSEPASLLNAALTGLGVAMVRTHLARAYLQRGALVQIGDVQIRAHLNYYFVWREDNPSEPAIRSLYQWLREQLESPAPE